MNQAQKINALIEEHQCEVHLRVHSPSLLLATYTYAWRDAHCNFTLLSEVAESLQAAFRELLKRRGLLQAGTRSWDEKPYVQDLLTPNPRTGAGKRWLNLMPKMEPRWVRVYDNEGRSFDRYTAVFSGKEGVVRTNGSAPHQYPYLAMSANPYHPQGFGQHGWSDGSACDTVGGKWPPHFGRKNHLGTRIHFHDLPADCQRCVLDDYLAIWRL